MSFLDDKLHELKKKGYQPPYKPKYGLIIYNLKAPASKTLWKWAKAINIESSLRPNFIWCHMLVDRFNNGRKPKELPTRPIVCAIVEAGLLEGEIHSKGKYLRGSRLVLYLGGPMLEQRRLELENMGFTVTKRTPRPHILLKLDSNEFDLEKASANITLLKETIPNVEFLPNELWRKWR